MGQGLSVTTPKSKEHFPQVALAQAKCSLSFYRGVILYLLA